jgi:SAM-dependent MidA family methyltransferase
VGDVPDGAAIIIANEFLDALPIRQLCMSTARGTSACVALDAQGALRFAHGENVAAPAGAPAQPEPGAIIELREGEERLLAELAARTQAFVALFIDYGPAAVTVGDTLQAVRRHGYVDPLAEPGAADLTAHVLFAGLADKARAAGLAADGAMTQAEFLGQLGIVERATRLMAANPAKASQIEAGVQRLMAPTGMGQLFKVLAVRSRTLPRRCPSDKNAPCSRRSLHRAWRVRPVSGMPSSHATAVSRRVFMRPSTAGSARRTTRQRYARIAPALPHTCRLRAY